MNRAWANFHFTMRTLRQHPLTRDRFAAALRRYVQWQIGSRLVPGPVVVPWVNGCRLLIARGMWGATLNVYCGLQDFEPMSFVVHLLREDDVFYDVGANVGVYSVLAAGVARARTVAVEPGAEANAALALNLRINNLTSRVETLAKAVGVSEGFVNFTAGLDTLNHVAATRTEQAPVTEVPMTSVDSVSDGSCPRLIKVDTEGYETPVIDGARRTLARDELWALILEFDGHGIRYNYDEAALHRRLTELDFIPHVYDPFTRMIARRALESPPTGNVLYLKRSSIEQVQRRLAGAPPFEVLGRRL